MKGNVKRIISGLLSMLTALSIFLQPAATYAAEPEPSTYETAYPALEKVKDKLAEDEIVSAENYEVEIGNGFDVEHDFSGMEFSADKVKVIFHEAKNEDGQSFDNNRPDIYRVVYFVEPVSQNPSYQISRNITVKEKTSGSSPGKQAAGDVGDGDSDSEGVDSEGEGLLLFSGIRQMARTSGTATMVRGSKIQYPSSMGDYHTRHFTVNGKVAYCLESAKDSPPTGDYAYYILEGNPDLQKALYYGYGGPGDITDNYMPTFSDDWKYVFTHIAASYFYCGIDGFAGCTMDDLEACGVLGWINYLASLPTPLDPRISFSKESLKAEYNGSEQVTEITTLEGDSRNSITIHLPDGVTFHNSGNGATQTGGDVSVCGGTNFFFSAPLTVSGDWSSGEMKGNVGSVWRAIVLSTGGSKQDIGSYYEEVNNNAVSLYVDWLERARVKVIKVDSVTNAALSGAIFGIYRDEACTDLITEMPATDQNGASEAEIVMTQDIVYLKEITAPMGYRCNTTVYRANLQPGQTVSVTIPDVEQLGSLTVCKEGEVLTGASSDENGTVFRYESCRQKGAVFHVYATKDITTPYGAVVYKAGDLVASNLVTGDNGSLTLKNLHLGTYRVVEVQAPKNFYNCGETKDITVAYAGQMAEAAFSSTTFFNDRQKAEISVVKLDKDTRNGLAGGIFGLYASENITSADGSVAVAKGTLLGQAVTDEDGKGVFSADVPIEFAYEVREIQAPEGYLKNTEDVYTFRFDYTNDQEAEVPFFHTFVNERVTAEIRLQKKDKETNTNCSQGDAVLEHAVYGLYAREEILHPDKKTGVLYKAGEQVGMLTTDKEGMAQITGLYLGNYFIKEISPSAGYLVDETEYDLTCSYEGDQTAIIERRCTSQEQVIKQPFQIIKAADNGKTDADLLSGAGFTAYLVSSLEEKENGGYDFDSAEPVVIGENGATEIFTDERGYACSIPLPFGTYIVRETITPHNYTPVKDFIVRITEHKPNMPQVWRVLLDDEFEAKLKIVKQDDETKKPVLAENTEFKVYDIDNAEYVEQVTTYPTVVTHRSYFTDSQGYLILPQNLKIGHYRVEEVNAPFGYTLNENYYEISIDSGTLYQTDEVSGDVVIDVVYENHPVKGKLQIVKEGEVLSSCKKDFIYETENLEGAEFEVYAAEDIYTADFQKDGNGNRILEYMSGELVGTLTTDKEGRATMGNLPLGTYRVVEMKAPEGFVLSEAEQVITFAYQGQDTPVVQQTAVLKNDRQKVEIIVVKKDTENGAVVEGAVFGLYAENDILAHGKVIVEAGTLLSEAVSGKDGKAVFDLDVPFGEYYIRELKAPEGYVSSDRTIKVSAMYQGQGVKRAVYTAEFENEPTKVAVKKTDFVTGVELEGASMAVIDKSGNVVDAWITAKGEEHIIERLIVGETYTLREELAPFGYLKAEEIAFTIEDTAEIQKVEMRDEVPTGMLLISKNGEFLENVTLLDSICGWIMHLFEYVTGSLKDVTFEVYAQEDIKAADGKCTDYYKKDELVASITTGNTGIAKLENLPLGKYYVKETETVEGYILDGEIREADLSYRDQDTEVVVFSTYWQNFRQKAEIHILKTEKDSDRVVEGTVFALCAKEDITNAGGEVVMEADTVIEEKATGQDGKLTFHADLPIGFSYYVKETAPAPGFACAGEVQELGFAYEDAGKESLTYELSFENQPTVFEFSKVSLTNGTEVEGAKLQVTDVDGGLVDEWVSGKEPHIIKELVVDRKYILTETRPADGYVTAESIEFIVENTGEVQKVVMADDVTKVEITKTDIAGEELPGAKLAILDHEGNVVERWISEDKPHYMEMLPIGEYTLHEESAPEGYVTAEDVKFEIKDIAEIQKVVMVDETKPTLSARTPKTGDNRKFWLWAALVGIAVCGIGGSAILFMRKKR